VATRVGIPDNDEDFGQTLGYWGVPAGPYLVVPILGPYTLRDGFGEIVDTTGVAYAYMNLFWFDVVGLNGWETTGGLSRQLCLPTRQSPGDLSRGDREQSGGRVRLLRLRPQTPILQNRQARVLDSTDTAAAVEEDLYFEDEEYEESEDEASGEESFDEVDGEDRSAGGDALDEGDAPVGEGRDGDD
jgi:hypothetical protein